MARRLLYEAREQLERGNLPSLETIDATRLSPEDRDVLAQTTKHLVLRQEIHECEMHYTAELGAEHYLAARTWARKLTQYHDGEEVIEWEEKLRELNLHIEEKWKPTTLDLSAMAGSYMSLFTSPTQDLEELLYLEDGRMISVSAHGLWLLILIMRPDGGRDGHLVHCPCEVLFPFISWDDRLWIATEKALLLVIRLDPFILEACYDFKHLLPDHGIETTVAAPRAGVVWVHQMRPRDHDIVNIIGIEQQRIARHFTLHGYPVMARLPRSFLVVTKEYMESTIRVYSDQGRLQDSFPDDTRGDPIQVAVHPDGKRLLALTFFDIDLELRLEILNEKHSPVHVFSKVGEGIGRLATSLEHGLIFVLWESDDTSGMRPDRATDRQRSF